MREAKHPVGANGSDLDLIRAMPDLVWFKDPEGRYQRCNARVEAFFGAEEARIVGRTDDDFVAADQAELFRRRDEEALSGGWPRAK